MTPETEVTQLVDRFGRVHRSLRISVIDVCNLRCQYCMPAEDAVFVGRQRWLGFADLVWFVQQLEALGLRNVRLTGGEPLLRPKLHEFVGMLTEQTGIHALSLTTNGMYLRGQVRALAEAGLRSINISLDTLRESTFQTLTRRPGVDQVLEGIEAAMLEPGLTVKLNSLVLRDVNLDEVMELTRFAIERGLVLRFIEFMPLDADRSWKRERLVSGAELRQRIEEQFGVLSRVEPTDASRPATEYSLANGARLGFIDSVSQPFCGSCDRLRITADGKLRNCLFGSEEWDVADAIRNQSSEQLKDILHAALQAKHAAHGIAEPNFSAPRRPMYQIGG